LILQIVNQQQANESTVQTIMNWSRLLKSWSFHEFANLRQNRGRVAAYELGARTSHFTK